MCWEIVSLAYPLFPWTYCNLQKWSIMTYLRSSARSCSSADSRSAFSRASRRFSASFALYSSSCVISGFVTAAEWPASAAALTVCIFSVDDDLCFASAWISISVRHYFCYQLQVLTCLLWHGSVMARALDFQSKGRKFDSWLFHFHVMILGKLLTYMCLCHTKQYNLVLAKGQWWCSMAALEGNRTSGVALAMCHILSGIASYGFMA